MEILIHIEKKKLDPDYEKAIAEYLKRLSAFCRTKCIYYKDFSKLALQNTSACFLIVPGTGTISSEAFASKIAQLGLSGYSRIEFVVRQPDVNNNPDDFSAYTAPDISLQNFALSGFMMSADLTAVVLTEQLYRAYTILNHITYHK